MMDSSKGKTVGVKQEGEIKLSKSTCSTTSTSRQWAGFKNPRIVRVSRTFGGKDRHSKVCTIRGLRDRRIRLSVPSAIQLYDLQDRLGLNQPSKVVDWLLDVTKDDIDKLPPLQMPPGDFTHFYQQTLVPHHHELNTTTPQSSSNFSPFFNSNMKYSKEGSTINDEGEDDSHRIRKSKFWASLDLDSSTAKNKEVEREDSVYNKWDSTIATNDHEQGNEGGNSSGSYIPRLSAQNFLPLVNQFPFPSLMNNNLSYNWEPPNLSLSQFGSLHHSHSTTHSSSLPLAHHSAPTSQLVFYPPPTTTPSFVPQYPYVSSSSVENDPKHVNHFQFMSSSSSNMMPNSVVSPFHFINPFNVNTKEDLLNNGTDTTK